MPAQMFDSESTHTPVGSRRWYAMPFAVLTHTFVIGALIVVPLLATNALPTPEAVLTFVVAPPAPTPPPPPVETPAAPPPPIAVDPVNENAAPIEAPNEIAPEPPPTLKSLVVIRGPVTPAAAGSAVSTLAAPPPPPVAQAPVGPLRPGGDIKEPKRIDGPSPVYPLIAKAARAEGSVILEAVIGKDGLVKDVRVTRSHPMFDEAALAAVRQWRYTVPMLNGQPIEVLMTVTVHFGLNR